MLGDNCAGGCGGSAKTMCESTQNGNPHLQLVCAAICKLASARGSIGSVVRPSDWYSEGLGLESVAVKEKFSISVPPMHAVVIKE